MAVRPTRKWPALIATAALLLVGGELTRVRADANGGMTAAIGLTAADGSVRTQAGVQLAVAPAPGFPDRVVAIGTPIRARVAGVRDCYAAAMARAPSVEGVAEFEFEASARGARVRVVRDATGDATLVACMRSTLATTSLRGVPRGSRALVRVQLTSPLAALRKQMAERPTVQAVRMLAGGRAESDGGTDDIRFRVSGSAYAASTIAGVAQGMSTRVAALLDCRRKAFRREREASGSITLDLTLRNGALAHGARRSTVKASASRCVASLLEQLDTASLADADLELAVSFAQR